MTDTGILCSGADVIKKAGTNANSTAVSEANTNLYISGAQCIINATSRYNFNDAYPALNQDVKFFLNQIASDIAAIYAIQYDMSAYTSRTEAEDMIRILQNRVDYGLALLAKQETVDFIKNA